MARIVGAVVAGFFAWLIAWISGEKIFSAIWPEAFGAHQRAFEAALMEGGQFTADTTHLLLQIVLGLIVTAMAGFLAARIARENKRAPLALGFVLLALGLLKAVMSWQLIPLWYHVLFTGLLLPMTVVGGKLRTSTG